MRIFTAAQLQTTGKPLAPSSGSRPDVPIKSEGQMRPDGEAVQREKIRSPRKFEAGSAIRPETAPPPQPPPTSQGAQVRVTWNGQPDVMMIHSDLEDEDDPRL